jgi:hypothetical protein
MVSDLNAHRERALASGLGHVVGYRVDAPEGSLGFVQRVPHAGLPPRPLTLVVSDGETVRFVSLRRIAAVVQRDHRIVLRPRPVALTETDSARRAA